MTADLAAPPPQAQTRTVTLTLRLFGALRRHQQAGPLRVQVPAGADLPALRAALVAELTARSPEFRDHALLEASAIADEAQVLSGDVTLTRDATLAVLPPVCGG